MIFLFGKLLEAGGFVIVHANLAGNRGVDFKFKEWNPYAVFSYLIQGMGRGIIFIRKFWVKFDNNNLEL